MLLFKVILVNFKKFWHVKHVIIDNSKDDRELDNTNYG